MSPMNRDKVFISYCHRDKDWMERLQKMLKPLVRSGEISLWADTAIQPGANWQQEIETALLSARVAILLVSAEFLASDFINERELPSLLRAAEEEGVRVLWIYLSSCFYDMTPIGEYQAAHDVAQPLEELSRPEQDRILLEISKQIQLAFAESLPCSVALEELSDRHEILPLPDRGDGITRVLSFHLGPTTVVGRCYAAQLRKAARNSLEALGEHRVHWVLNWDDERLNQITVCLRCRTTRARSYVEVHNITDYSMRKQPFSVTVEAGSERVLQAGEKAEFPLHPGVAMTFTSGLGSGRQQLLNLVSEVVSCGGTRFPVLHTTATTFLFPPSGGDEATLVRYLGGWIPLDREELGRLLTSGAQPVGVCFPRDGLDLWIDSFGGRLRAQCNTIDLTRFVGVGKGSSGGLNGGQPEDNRPRPVGD